MLRECHTLLLHVSVQVDSPDMWRWQPNPVHGYSVRDAYMLLTSQALVTLETAEDLLWHKHVPLVGYLVVGIIFAKTNIHARCAMPCSNI
ncbi:hypothetical protein QL285_014515 [Trifolium repens]|nr:hypothetical protein QL285_014515 [Trifolium repens]